MLDIAVMESIKTALRDRFLYSVTSERVIYCRAFVHISGKCFIRHSMETANVYKVSSFSSSSSSRT